MLLYNKAIYSYTHASLFVLSGRQSLEVEAGERCT
jgi:hypothetical protein